MSAKALSILATNFSGDEPEVVAPESFEATLWRYEASCTFGKTSPKKLSRHCGASSDLACQRHSALNGYVPLPDIQGLS